MSVVSVLTVHLTSVHGRRVLCLRCLRVALISEGGKKVCPFFFQKNRLPPNGESLFWVRHVTSTSRHAGTRHVTSAAYRYGSSTRYVVATWQGFDTPRCCHLPGYQPSLRLSVGKFQPSPIQSVVPVPSESFFSLFNSPYSSRAHFDTFRSGPPDVTGFMESLVDLMSQAWGVRKSLSTMSNAGDVGGWQKW